jgi:hypothetical protein
MDVLGSGAPRDGEGDPLRSRTGTRVRTKNCPAVLGPGVLLLG